jgi:hypothetical protein
MTGADGAVCVRGYFRPALAQLHIMPLEVQHLGDDLVSPERALRGRGRSSRALAEAVGTGRERADNADMRPEPACPTSAQPA